ncbi:MAG: hypothetical protein ABIP17_04540 [Ilumatobacteraceae bacterium]
MSEVGRRLGTLVAVIAGCVVLTVGVAAPPERCPTLTPSELTAATSAAAGWLIDNQNPDGTWLYEYDRITDAASNDYNVVRHAGAMSALYQAGNRGIAGALESADRGLAWALDHTVERHEWIGVTDGDNVQAGTNSLLIAALVERRLATGDPAYDALMSGLARFLTAQQEPNGSLLAYYDLEPDAPRPDTYSIYYTGEAYWALGRMHNLEPDADWGRAADQMGSYMAIIRDDAEDLWPPLADHWSGYGLAETAAFPERTAGAPLTDAELSFVRRQGGMMGQRVRSISQRFGPWGVAVRGTFTPRGGGYGVFGEGLAGLWRASQLDDRLADERASLGERALCIVGLAVDAQADADAAAAYADPTKVEGAWFIDDVTRMDDQQHALSALLFATPILAAGPFDTGTPSPALWVWLLAVFCTINPLRASFGIPHDQGSSRRVRLAAVGGVVGALTLLAVGALSGWLIEVGETSAPAVRLAAGSLCLLSAGMDLARRPVVDEPTLPGWRAALMPVTAPLFVRPVMVVAGLALVADHGIGAYLLALALTAGSMVAATALDVGADRPGAVWMSRLMSAVGIAVSVLLIADAVFDI